MINARSKYWIYFTSAHIIHFVISILFVGVIVGVLGDWG